MLGAAIIVAAAVLMLRAVLLLRRVGDCSGRLDDVRFIASSLRTELSHASASSRTAWWLTLGVARDASIAQIDQAYRSQVKASHLDQTGGRGTGLDLAALQRARMDGRLEARKRAWWSQSGDRRAERALMMTYDISTNMPATSPPVQVCMTLGRLNCRPSPLVGDSAWHGDRHRGHAEL